MSIVLIPAIDLMGGQVVRLRRGEAGDKVHYGVDPEKTAADFEAAGAKRLHVVDLDGAFEGAPRNLAVIRAIRKAAPNLVLEVGGGLRDQATVETLLDSGVDHAVLGTKALEDEGFLRELLRNFGRKIIVGADTREGRIATRGWTSQTEVVAIPFLKRLHDEAGLSTVIFTDIARDGMLSGPNLPALVELADAIPGLGVIASGGVGTAEHLRDLAKLRKANIVGVIVGKALYDGRVTIQDGLEALGN